MTNQSYPILAAYSAVKTYLREPSKPQLPIVHDRAIDAQKLHEKPNFTRKDQWVMESATD